MLSIRERVLQAFFDRFAGLSAYPLKKRMPNWLIDPGELPALIQIDGGSEPLGGDDASSGYGDIVRIQLRVTVIAGLRGETTDDLGADLSAARADILVAATGDPTLGGLASNVRWDGDEDPVPLVETGAPPHAVFGINFLVIYQEAADDPFSST